MSTSSCFTWQLNGAQHNYCKGDTIKIDQQQNYYRLLDNHNVEGSRFIKQRSQSWFELRKQMKVTGSTMNKAVGIDGLKKQQEYFDHVIYGKTDESMTHDAKTTKAMDYGVKHEIDAVGTLVGRILPAYFPELLYCEEGCALINKDNELFYLSSPDGSIRSSVYSEPTFMYETKCKPPVPTTQMTPVYYTIPKYYIMQILGEMKSYDSKQLIFTCWSEQSTVVMKADFSNDLWQDAWAECCKIYDINCPRRPYKRSAESIQIQDKLSIYLEEHTKIICELPSLKVENSNQSDSSTEGNESPFATPLPLDAEKEEEYVKCDTVLSTLFQVNKWLKHTYELNRSVASEILLFMANDLDRQYNPEGNNSHPIAYAMKGSSLPLKNFRLMVDKVIEECESKGMPILVVSTDGQWGRYGTRSFKDGPLTRLQLQKDLWHEIQALSKTELKNWLKELNKVGAEDHLREIRVLKANGDKPQLVVEGMVNESVLPRTSTHILKIMFQNEEKRGKKARQINAETDTNASTLNETDLLESIPTNLEVDTDLLTELDKLFADVDMTSEEQAEYINDWPESLEESHAITDAVERLPVSNTGDSELDDQSNHYVNAAGSNNTNSTNISRFEVLTDKDYLMMFEELKRSDSKEKWHSMTLDTFKHLFQNKETIDKSFCKTEVKVCVRATQGLLKKYGLTATLSRSKYDLVQSIATLTCNSIESSIVSHKKKCQSVKAKRINPKSLRVLCLKQTTQKYSKKTLSVLRAECMYHDKLMTWINTSSPVPHGINLDGLDTSVQWFSQPETCKDGKTRFHLVDACHILTCIRTKICTSGIPDAGLSRKAWKKAALSSETTLNIALITDCVDKQSVPYACKVFAKDVENYMIKSNDLKEAEFTKLIREWFEAEDERGLTAVERCKRRLALREWLLRGVRFDEYPPHGMYIKGFPSVTFEALLTHIERKLQLFQYAPGKRYNVRSIGSQEVESFFSTLRDLDPNGHGTMKPDDIPHIMRVAMELDDAKLDPNR